MSRLVFTPWRVFDVFRDHVVTQSFLRRIASTAEAEFKQGIASPKHGRLYRRRGRSHRASAPGEFPAKDSGAHVATVSSRANTSEAVVGSGMFYARYLRDGTRKMAKRKMSKEALRQAMDKDAVGVGRFVRFR